MSKNYMPDPAAPQTVSELFPSKFLRPEDLKGKDYTLEISAVEFNTVHDKYVGDVQKAVLRFRGAQKGLILNVTQATVLAEALHSERFTDWTGHRITLRPGRAHNGKPTILVSLPPETKIPAADVAQSQK